MHPTLVTHPFHRHGWVYEEKYDGWRLIAHKADDQVRLVSRNGRDHTRRFAEVAAAIAARVFIPAKGESPTTPHPCPTKIRRPEQ